MLDEEPVPVTTDSASPVRSCRAAAGIGPSLLPVAMAEQAVVPNAVESVRQHVEEKPSNEFARGARRNRTCPSSMSSSRFVGDGDAVGVAADVVQDLLGSREGRLRVHDPFRASSGREVLEKGRSIAQGFERRAGSGSSRRLSPQIAAVVTAAPELLHSGKREERASLTVQRSESDDLARVIDSLRARQNPAGCAGQRVEVEDLARQPDHCRSRKSLEP